MTSHDRSGHHQLARDFLDAIAAGELPEHLVTDDMSAWTLTSGDTDKARFRGGVKVLASIFGGTLHYTVKAMTAEEDRVVAEVHSDGTLIDGEAFHNVHVFTFRIRDGRIAWVGEYMNPVVVQERIVPLMMAAMAN
ncbi:MAG TPA: nuclear transport factor 2 family protein [Porticoccaceae bacterium]